MLPIPSGTALPRLVAALLLVALAAPAAFAQDVPWGVGSNWLVVRGGYAKSTAETAANGGAGYGFGFRHMLAPTRVNQWQAFGVRPLGFLKWTLFKRFSLGGFVDYDVLGRFASASEIEISAAVDLTRHFMWEGAAKPYLGLGAGPFYRKTYNTGGDFTRVDTGGFVHGGIDIRVASNQLLGFDARFARVPGENKPVNPVFGGGQNEATHWSVKLGYAIQY